MVEEAPAKVVSYLLPQYQCVVSKSSVAALDQGALGHMTLLLP